MCLFNTNRQTPSSSASIQLITTRTGTTLKRLKQSTLRHTSRKPKSQQTTSTVTWNMAGDDDITVLESMSNHISAINEQRPKKITRSNIQRKQKERRRRQPFAPSTTKNRQRPSQLRIKTTDNHIKKPDIIK
jgi:hypothetical protein